MSKHTKLLQFDKKTVTKIAARDKGCIFCRIGYHMPQNTNGFELQIYDIMHYVNKSRGGLGIEQNGALGCRYHHSLLDNGNQGLRQEMVGIFKRYLMEHYDGWDEIRLVYRKC